MKIRKLTIKEEFDSLKKGDIVIVEWNERATEHRRGKPITTNHIHGMHNGNELILDKRVNSYFNVDMFMKGESSAKEAYLVEGEGST